MASHYLQVKGMTPVVAKRLDKGSADAAGQWAVTAWTVGCRGGRPHFEVAE